MIRSGLSLASGFGENRRLLILTYHRVLASPDPCIDDVTGRIFSKHAEMLSRYCNVIRLDRAVEMLADRTLPPRAVAITFDDGYADNHGIALPILQRFDLTATFFVATGYLDGGVMWNDIVIRSIRDAKASAIERYRSDVLDIEKPVTPELRKELIGQAIGEMKYLEASIRSEAARGLADSLEVEVAGDEMMRATDVKALADAGMEIGGHTVSHPILKNVSLEEAEKEIVSGRSALEEMTGRRVTSFAFPNGRPGIDFGAEHVALLGKLGFTAGVTTQPGNAGYASDRLALPRVSAWHDHRGKFLARLGLWFRQGNG